MRTRFGERLKCFKCLKEATYYRVTGRRCFECEHCGYQVYPTAGTPFESTRTPLRDWFYVMFLFCASRNGVAAKEVQRQLGVTYKTAWRMCNLIRKYMGYVDGDYPVGGHGKTMEVDETFIGGKDTPRGRQRQGRGARDCGAGRRHRDPSRAGPHQPQPCPACRQLRDSSGTRIATDEHKAYALLTENHGYEHVTVDHSAKEYVRDDVHTNSIEGFWANVKRGIKGTYVWVSKRSTCSLTFAEFEYRHNLRRQPL